VRGWQILKKRGARGGKGKGSRCDRRLKMFRRGENEAPGPSEKKKIRWERRGKEGGESPGKKKPTPYPFLFKRRQHTA